LRYADFRVRFEGALQDAGLFRGADRRVETIDLGDGVWHWELTIGMPDARAAEPFYVSAVIAFTWDPINAARAYTTEEDLLEAVVGRRPRPVRTERRWVRVDLSLHARLPYGSTTPLPGPQLFTGWTAAVEQHMDATFTEIKEKQGRIVAILGGDTDLDVRAQYKSGGVLSLNGVSISAFRIVHVPRVWDDPARREAERNANDELNGVAQMFRTALDDWTPRVAQLAAWIRYSPPSAGTTPIGPWFDDQDDADDDDGPETTH
jgi:hypothetical protein